MMSTEFDAIVVGGGHNGLVAGAYLSRAGLSTLVVERRDVAGGLTAPVEYFPGYTASITNSPGSLEPIIVHELKLVRFGLDFLKPDPALVFPFPDGRKFIGWRDRAKTFEELAQFSRHDAERYDEFFAYLEEFATLLNANIFEAPPTFAEMTRNIDNPRAEEMFAKIMFGSVQSLVDEWFESDEVKALIASVAIVANLAGPRSPGTVQRLLARPLSIASSPLGSSDDPRRQVMRGSTGLPRGGMGAIATAMTASFTAAGGTLIVGTGVESVLVAGDRVTGVALTDGREFFAPVVLSNLNPKTTLLDLVPREAVPADFRDRVDKLPMNGSAFKVGLALSEMPRFAAANDDDEAVKMAGCQFRIAPSLDYVEAAYDDAKRGRPSAGPMLWGLTPSVMDPSVAPEGKHIMSVNVFHAPYDLEGADWATERDRYGRHCIDVLDQYIPNLKSSIIDARFWSPRDLEDEYGLIGGNITHGDTMPSNMFSFRPLPGASDYRTPVAGLYLCGSGSWPGGSVSGVPGRNAAQTALHDIRVGEK